MTKIKLGEDLKVIENDTIHTTIFIGEDEHMVYLGIKKDQKDYGYTIGYIDENLSDEEINYVEKYIAEHKKAILDLIRKSVWDKNNISLTSKLTKGEWKNVENN